MATHTINHDRTTQWKVNQDNDSWTLAQDAELYVKGVPAVLIDKGFDNNTLNIYGDILNLGTEAYGIANLADNTTINIGVKGEIKGIPPPKAVCRDLLIGFKCMAYVMHYNHFPH